MSETPTPEPAAPQADTVSASVRLREAHGDDLSLLTMLVLGAAPLVLIRVGVDEHGDVEFDVDATGPDTHEKLADLLDLVTTVLRGGTPVDDEPTAGPCSQCVDPDAVVVEAGMCASCLHNARRSGWEG